LFDARGAHIADGELLQLPRGNAIDSRMTFRFTDGSYFDERVTFTQNGVFRMRGYRLVQKGPAFAHDLDVTLAANGAYSVRAVARKDGEVDTWTDTLEMPPDVYNGMVVTIAKNLAPGGAREVHVVAFRPKPMMIALEYRPAGYDALTLGREKGQAFHYVLKPKLGKLMSAFAHLVGKNPPDSHTWIVTKGAPAFVRYQGPLFSGPAWRIDLTAPKWQ
jgi:hypothetical protein